ITMPLFFSLSSHLSFEKNANKFTFLYSITLKSIFQYFFQKKAKGILRLLPKHPPTEEAAVRRFVFGVKNSKTVLIPKKLRQQDGNGLQKSRTDQ
ncbi:MAG: hypothetical protein U0L60_00330, partial [Ruminococcus sp.]|nr:hypothetical protein [Ruminococcus sp.]